MRLDDPKRVVRRVNRLRARRGTCRVQQELSRGGTEAAADHDQIGIEDVHERADRRAEETPDLGERLDRAFVTVARLLEQEPRVPTGTVELRGRTVGSVAGRVRLDVTAAVTVPLARLSTGDDDGVPELRPAAIQVTVDDNAAADPRSEREHDHVRHAPPCSQAPLGQRGGVAVILGAGRKPEAVARSLRKVDILKRQIDGLERQARTAIDVQRDAEPDCERPLADELRHDAVDRSEYLLLARSRSWNLDRTADLAPARDESREDLGTAQIDADNAFFTHAAATILARMPEEQKPYTLYKGGRAKGKVPLRRPGSGSPPGASAAKNPGKPRERHVGRWLTLTLATILLLAIVWLVASYLSVSRGITDANSRVPKPVLAELTAQKGMLSSTPTTILVLGTDGGTEPGRSDAHRSDSIMLIRTDPGKHRLAFLSIPRDLRVDIPGYGPAKINAANQLGGPVLALKTVENLTGLHVNHVAFVDFDRFKELIDAVGGITVDVAKPILANKFDCPYASDARCAKWPGWRFAKGTQHMDGSRALVYSRIRENRLDPSETDLDRARRQQQVIQATADKVTSIGTAVKLPFKGGAIVKPLATDLSAAQVMELGWAYFRADKGKALHCRLGGEPGSADGESVIFGSEDNVATLAMFVGRSAPLPPVKGSPYAPGCVAGDRRL